MNKVLNKIRQDNKELITTEELKNYCKELYFNYRILSNYLISRKYLVKVLEGIYYVKTNEEIAQNKLNLPVSKLLAKALRLKNIHNWYYGLYTALKLNGIDYNHKDKFYYLINNRILKNRPIKILGKRYRFIRFQDTLFNFGIINGKVKYSDLEKTILDLLYLWEYTHRNENRILIELSKLLEGTSLEKILDYSQYYPKSNRIILKKALNNF
jgi:predicted transcriptional regulator of viral defense system